MAVFTGTFAGDIFTVAAGDNRYEARGGNDIAVFDFRLTDAVVSYAGNQVIVETATSHTVLTGSRPTGSPTGPSRRTTATRWSRISSTTPTTTMSGSRMSTPMPTTRRSGWREGRNPNAFFDTNYYLASNPDVAASGVNPLVHYDLHGWKEGRLPSLAFDQQSYLITNPGLAASGINPLAHFLRFGGEGRDGQPGHLGQRGGERGRLRCHLLSRQQSGRESLGHRSLSALPDLRLEGRAQSERVLRHQGLSRDLHRREEQRRQSARPLQHHRLARRAQSVARLRHHQVSRRQSGREGGRHRSADALPDLRRQRGAQGDPARTSRMSMASGTPSWKTPPTGQHWHQGIVGALGRGSFAITADRSGGGFEVDASTGVVTVANGACSTSTTELATHHHREGNGWRADSDAEPHDHGDQQPRGR